MKSLVSMLIGALAATSMAQTLFYDNFENRDYGFFQTQGPDWFGGTYPDDAPDAFPRVVGQTGDVHPYQGEKMYEIRGSSRMAGHTVFSNFDGMVRQEFAVGFDCRVYVPKERVPGQVTYLDMRLTTGDGVSIYFDRNTGIGKANAEFGGTFSLDVLQEGGWNHVSLQLSRLTNRYSFRLNGIMVQDFERRSQDKNWFMTSADVGTIQFQNVEHLYDPALGTPGVFIDNYHTYAVPEPSSIAVMTGIMTAAMLRRRLCRG